MDNETTATPNRKRRLDAPAGRLHLSHDEVKELAKAAAVIGRHGQRDKLLIMTMFRHGLRVSEAINLQWSQIDFTRANMHVARLKGSNSGTHPISGPELRDLRAWLRAVHEAEIRSAFVFTSEQGSPLDRTVVHRILSRASLTSGLGFHVHPHMLRHSCGFKLANEQETTDTRQIQDFLGHASIANTVRYTKLNAKRFNGLWKE